MDLKSHLSSLAQSADQINIETLSMEDLSTELNRYKAQVASTIKRFDPITNNIVDRSQHMMYIDSWMSDVVASNFQNLHGPDVPEFYKMLKTLNSRVPYGILQIEYEIDFQNTPTIGPGNIPVRYIGLLNIITNAHEANLGNVVTLTISDFKGAIASPIYIPDGVSTTGRFVKINVHDTGQGFPPAEDPRVFFAWGKSTKKGEGRGSGLGLFYLACKYLGNIPYIESKPGDTNIGMLIPVT